MRSNPEEASRYSKFKEELASRYESTKEYSPAKKLFVQEMEKKALLWYEKNQLEDKNECKYTKNKIP